MFKNISRQQSHFKRYRQITMVLLKNGLGFFVEKFNLNKYLPYNERINKDREEMSKKSTAQRIRAVFEELGPTFIKFGQLLSTRPDILSPEYIKEFSKLQDEVPPVDYSEIENVLIAELGENYSERFLEIEKKSCGAASIAQTHRAFLCDGKEVIIKIQRPNIKEKIKVDLDILRYFAGFPVEDKMFSGFIEPLAIVEEFSENLLKELDFTREIGNMNKFRDNFEENSDIIIPEVYKNLSTERIIVMERIKGISLKKLPESGKQIDRSYLARLGTEAFLQQILIDGFFHADPHPGNIYVIDKKKLAFIDFGIVGRLSPEMQNSLSIFFIALLKKNVNIIIDEIYDIGVIPRDINEKKLKNDLQEMIDLYYGVELGNINLKSLLNDFQKIIYKYHIHMPREFFLLIRAIAVSEGVGLMIDPSLNIVEAGNDFLSKLIKHKLKPENLMDKAVIELWKLYKSSKKIPLNITELINKLSSDKFTINFKHMNLENFINKLDIISNRLSISLIVSALIIGSSMILRTDLKPKVMNIPLLGLSGYIIAGIFGVILLIDIFRSGRY